MQRADHWIPSQILRYYEHPASHRKCPYAIRSYQPRTGGFRSRIEALSENDTEETPGYRADKRDVTDFSMTHMKEFSKAESKQGLNQDDRGGCQRDFLVKAKRLGGVLCCLGRSAGRSIDPTSLLLGKVEPLFGY
jgi:hypothetical protein